MPIRIAGFRRLSKTSKLLIALFIVCAIVAGFFPLYRLLAVGAALVSIMALMTMKFITWRSNRRVKAATDILVNPVGGWQRKVYDFTDATLSPTGGAQTELLVRRETILKAPVTVLGQTVGVEGPKGGSAKTFVAAVMSGAHASVDGSGTLLVEATTAGSLPSNFGVLELTHSSRTLWEAMTKEAQARSVASQLPGVKLLPSMSRGEFRTHCFTGTDTGLDILFAAYEESMLNSDGTEAEAWFDPSRLSAIHAEGVTQYPRVTFDTGNEATPLKRAALSLCDAFVAVATTNPAQIDLTLRAIENRLQPFKMPIVTVVVNVKGDPMSRVLEVMRQFGAFGPVRQIEHVRQVHDTNNNQFLRLPLPAQEQAMELDATATELLNGNTPSTYPSGREYRPLNRASRSTIRKTTLGVEGAPVPATSVVAAPPTAPVIAPKRSRQGRVLAWFGAGTKPVASVPAVATPSQPDSQGGSDGSGKQAHRRLGRRSNAAVAPAIHGSIVQAPTGQVNGAYQADSRLPNPLQNGNYVQGASAVPYGAPIAPQWAPPTPVPVSMPFYPDSMDDDEDPSAQAST